MFGGRLEGLRNIKRGFWVCFSKKNEKRGKFYVGCKVWPKGGNERISRLLPAFREEVAPG